MSHPLSLALCVLDSSKGHFGRRDIYQRSINDLASKIPLDQFKVRLAHVKVGGPDEEATFKEQEAFYLARGFEVLRSDESWSHFSPSHQQGYSRDMVKVYGHPSVLSCQYVLHWESDWGISLNGGDELVDLASEGLSYLAATPQLLGVRFPRFLNEVARLNNLKRKHGLNVWTEQEKPPFSSFTRTNDSLILNPQLFRSRDFYAATRIMKQNFAQLGQHVEMGFTHAWTHLADGALPWAIYDPARVSCLHFGTKPGEEDVAGNVYERIDP